MDCVSNIRKRVETQQPNNSPILFRPYEDIALSTGRKESGKSYAVKKILKSLKRVIVWDYNWEYDTPETRKIDPTYIIVHDLGMLDAYWKMGTTKMLSVVKIAYQPQKKTLEKLTEFLNHIVNNYRFLTVVIEEIAVFQTSKKFIEPLKQILDTGRHQLKIGLLVCSRRSHGIMVDIPYNADHILAFMQHRPEDIAYLGDYMDSDLIEKLKDCKPHSFVYFTGKDGKSVIHQPL